MAMATPGEDQDGFPCALTINVPFPSARLASVAHRALSVDKELSALVQRRLSTTTPPTPTTPEEKDETVLRVEYKATTNRMLRVAVNSFMESLALVLEVMEELDVDVLEQQQQQQQQQDRT